MIRDVKYPRQPTVAFRGCKAEIAKAKAWDVSSYQLNEVKDPMSEPDAGQEIRQK